MKRPSLRARRYIASVLILIGVFNLNAGYIYAFDVGSIVGAAGPVAGAAIGCVVKGGGLSKIFGSGDGSSGSNLDNSGNGDGSDAGNSGDGDLDGGGTGEPGPSPENTSGETDGGPPPSSENTSNEGKTNESESTGTMSVPVSDTSVAASTKKTKEATEATNKKLTCTNAIQRAATQVILQQLTQKTLNWVNNGFKGGWDKDATGQSSYIKDTGTFLRGIADQAIGDFASSIGCTGRKDADLKKCMTDFPFGRLVAQQLITSSSIYFEQANRSSLNGFVSQGWPDIRPEILGYKSFVDGYFHDFGIGGWNAFIGQTLQNNNPYGFSMAARDELGIRIDDTNYSRAQDIKDQLARNQGFLDLKTCVQSVTDTRTDPNGQPIVRCQLWQTTTPGSIVVNQLNTALGSTFRQLEVGQDLSSNITAIFNALLNQLVQKGLAGISTDKSNNIVQDPNTNVGYVSNTVSIDGNSFNSGYLDAGNAFETNIFDLSPNGIDPSDPTGKRKNLVFLISREKQLIANDSVENRAIAEKLGWGAGSNEEAVWTATMQKVDPNYRNLLGRQVTLAKRLIPAIYQLDYCIPGPHPGWQNDSDILLQNELNKWPRNTDDSGGFWGAIGQILDPAKTIVNLVKTETQDKRSEQLYSNIVSAALTMHGPGVGVARDEHVNGYDNATYGVNLLAQRYAKVINSMYTTINIITVDPDDGPSISPSLLAENKAGIAKIVGYQNGIKANTEEMDSARTLIDQLVRLGGRIHALKTNEANLVGFPASAPETNEDFQNLLSEIEAETNTASLTPFQRELKKINDTFNLIAPDLHGDSYIAAQEATLNNITNTLEDISGDGGFIEECLDVVLDPKYTGLNTRRPFPASLSGYLPQSFLAKFASSPNASYFSNRSFLPDWHYAQGDWNPPSANEPETPGMIKHGWISLGGKGGGQFFPGGGIFPYDGINMKSVTGSNLITVNGTTLDTNKLIKSADAININNQNMVNALSGLEEFLGVY